MMVSPTWMFCRREVSGPLGTLIEKKLQMLFPVGADDGIGPQQGLVIDFRRPIMVKWPLEKRSPGSRVVVKENNLIGPVVHRQNTFFVKSTHKQCSKKSITNPLGGAPAK